MKRRVWGTLMIGALAATWPMLAAGQRAQSQSGESAVVPTPRRADGRPDLSGNWTGGGGGGGFGGLKVDEATGNITQTFLARGASSAKDAGPVNIERDAGIRQRMAPNKPLYKPEFWEKVQRLDQNGNVEDPAFSCWPNGVPRMGPPSEIVQTPTKLIFLYQSRNTFRTVYMDGRSHHPKDTWEGTWMGHSVGHWDGDTLVVDTVDFNDTSWIDWPGYFHTDEMHVIERFHRDGNTLRWQATVEDLAVLMKPWVMNPRVARLNPDPNAELAEDLPCVERSLQYIVTKERG